MAGALRLKLPLGFVLPLLVAYCGAFKRTILLSPGGLASDSLGSGGARGLGQDKGLGGKLEDDKATSPGAQEAVASDEASSACAGALPCFFFFAL